MLFTKLELHTHNFEKQKLFYREVLGFEILDSSNDFFEIDTQQTCLKFIKSNQKNQYHFSLLIAPKHFDTALKYMESKGVELLPLSNQHKVMEWESGGRSFYFLDKDQNIIEFLAQANIDAESQAEFTLKEVIQISKIGLVVEDPISTSLYLLNEVQLTVPEEFLKGFHETFCWFGDEHTAIICVDKNHVWYPTTGKAVAADFNLIVEEENKKIRLSIEKGKIQTNP